MKNAEPMHKVLVWGTSVATPAACAFEYLLRKAFFPADFEELRSFLRPWLGAPAWGLAALTALCAAGGFVLQRSLVRQGIAKIPEAERTPQAERKVRTAAFLLTTSLPQAAALASTFAFTFGAPFVPVAVAMLVATTAVARQGYEAYRA